MYKRHLQFVLRCQHCNKPFDKESSLKRHGYYCRSRRVSCNTRARSCLSCARRKARCDKQPKCSRCLIQGLECHYPANRSETTVPCTQQSADASIKPMRVPSLQSILEGDSPDIVNSQDAGIHGTINFDNRLIQPDTLANGEREYTGWNDQPINFPDFLETPTNIHTVQSPFLEATASANPQTSSANQALLSSSDVSIPAVPRSDVRSLLKRPQRRDGMHRTTFLMIQNLKSYPMMMTSRPCNPPPFIHPHSVSCESENNRIEPLNNCISLVHMISSGVKGNRKLFWRNVRLECEHFHGELSRLSKRELLAAMQALSIYVCVRIDEGETEHNNLDHLLFTTAVAVARQAQNLTYSGTTGNAGFPLNNSDLESTWKDWIFEESIRRTCLVYQIIDMLIYFEAAELCDMNENLILAPLPIRKQLWELNDAMMWKTENERDPGAAFGLAANGELVNLEESLHCWLWDD